MGVPVIKVMIDRRIINLIVIMIANFLIIGCQSSVLLSNSEELSIPKEKVDVPLGIYRQIMWFPDNQVLVESNRQIKQLSLTDGNLSDISFSFENDPKCTQKLEYHGTEVLPDGRLGICKRCVWPVPEKPYLFIHENHLLAYTFNSSDVEDITPNSVPEFGNVCDSTWNPDLTQGIQLNNKVLNWLSPSGISPLDIAIESDGRKWFLGNRFEDTSSKEGGNFYDDEARAPSWSPDGKTMAFFAYTDTNGPATNFPQFNEFQLYLMDTSLFNPKSVADGFIYPHMLEWSPDSKHLAITATFNAGKSALVLYSIERGNLQVIERGHFGSVSWSPDGDFILASRFTNHHFEETEIFLYDVRVLKDS